MRRGGGLNRPADSGAGDGFGFFVEPFGWGAQVPDDVEEGEEFEDVVGDVDFPPVEALAGADGVAVVVVVPAFAHGDEGEGEAVAAVVGGVEAAGADDVGEGVDAEGGVIDEDGAQEKSPEDELP